MRLVCTINQKYNRNMNKYNIDIQSVLVFARKNPVSIRLNNVHDIRGAPIQLFQSRYQCLGFVYLSIPDTDPRPFLN